MSDKFLYSFYGDGTTTWVYRCDKSGNVVRAKTTSDHYEHFDLAELPTRISIEFRDASERRWSEQEEIQENTLTTEVPENSEDTGMTDEEFIEYVLAHHLNVKFENHKFWMLVEGKDFSKKYVEMPYSMLRAIARRCRYFGLVD
ncbi:hypothetical protein [Bacteroides sp.]|uniref:hypothetical protein n=1 Tax=Bacteroides sp. TaxID=29523 RepID=UPI00260C58E7|nr:hypothetical protein [Bacteroides sp.]MDD3040723.1 hypothetical protein [Bacteroides sp.]